MIDLPLHKQDLRFKSENEIIYIWDIVRNKWLVKTPEEIVRQAFLKYIITTLEYPVKLIGVEKKINIGHVSKRYDIVVFGEDFKPWMMIECKSSEVEINEKVLKQIANYNITIDANFLVLTNGISTFCYNVSQKEWLEKLPIYINS